MPEDLIILQFLKVFSDFENWRDWSYFWSIPAVIAFVLSVALEVWLLRTRKKKANLFLLGMVLAVIFCEYGYQATPGFEAFFFAMAEMVILFALLGTACGAVIDLIWRIVNPQSK